MESTQTTSHDQPSSDQPSRNPLGTGGFLLSLLGVTGLAALTVCVWTDVPSITGLTPWAKLAFGVTGPLGLMLSAMGAFRLPKQLATAGIVLGLAGTLWLSGVGVVLVADAMGLFSDPQEVARQREADAIAAVKKAVELVEAEEARRGGVALSDEAGQQLIAGQVDGWQKPLIYQRLSNRDFEIISAGPDEEYGSEDDITSRTIGQSEFEDNLNF